MQNYRVDSKKRFPLAEVSIASAHQFTGRGKRFRDERYSEEEYLSSMSL